MQDRLGRPVITVAHVPSSRVARAGRYERTFAAYSTLALRTTFHSPTDAALREADGAHHARVAAPAQHHDAVTDDIRGWIELIPD